MWINYEGNYHDKKFPLNKKNIYFFHGFDKEFSFQNNIICQPSATLEKSVSIPYPPFNYIKNINLSKNIFKYDLSFVGTYKTRKNIINNIFKLFDNKKVLIIIRDKISSYDNIKNNKNYVNFNYYNRKDNFYYKSIINSKLCLCPRGRSLQSIRFYDVMKSGRIPVFISDKNAKLPLDWIIDWENIIPIINIKDLDNYNKKINNIIDKWLLLSDEDLIIKGNKCKNIFYKYLNIFNDKKVFLNFKKEIIKKYSSYVSSSFQLL